MEWLWVLALVLIIFGPIVWAVTRDRDGGAPKDSDATAGSAVTDGVRHTASGGRTPGGSGKGGPLPRP